jgi:hypothetical protein
VTRSEATERRPAVTLGYWSALICAAGALGYGAASIAVGAFATSAITYQGYESFVAGYSLLPTFVVVLPPFVVALAFPALVAALYATIPPERRSLGVLALVFAGVYSALLGSAYWLQLTYVPWNIMRGAGIELAPWIMWNPASVFWAFETFAYFAMGVACLFIGLALVPRTVPRRIRRGLIAMGALGLYFMATALKDPILDPADGDGWATALALSAMFAWVALFGFVAAALTGMFAEQRRRPEAIAPAEAAIVGEPS